RRAEAFEPVADPLPGPGVGHAFQLGQVEELLLDAELLVEAALFGHVAHARLAPRPDGPALVAHLALVGHGDVGHHAQRRRLAGAVGAEQTQDPPRLRLERDAVDGGEAAVALEDAIDGESTHSAVVGCTLACGSLWFAPFGRCGTAFGL